MCPSSLETAALGARQSYARLMSATASGKIQRSKWKKVPLASDGPIVDRVHIANRPGAERMLELHNPCNPPDTVVINVSDTH